MFNVVLNCTVQCSVFSVSYVSELEYQLNPKLSKGPSINDVRKILSIFDPTPPVVCRCPVRAYTPTPSPLSPTFGVHIHNAKFIFRP